MNLNTTPNQKNGLEHGTSSKNELEHGTMNLNTTLVHLNLDMELLQKEFSPSVNTIRDKRSSLELAKTMLVLQDQ